MQVVDKKLSKHESSIYPGGAKEGRTNKPEKKRHHYTCWNYHRAVVRKGLSKPRSYDNPKSITGAPGEKSLPLPTTLDIQPSLSRTKHIYSWLCQEHVSEPLELSILKTGNPMQVPWNLKLLGYFIKFKNCNNFLTQYTEFLIAYILILTKNHSHSFRTLFEITWIWMVYPTS